MTTCEHCGADAVGADGLCRACGWQAGGVAALGAQDAPSLAETREADVPMPVRSSLLARPQTPARPAANGARSSYADHSTIGMDGRPSGADLGMGPSSRYCGTCGARIEGGKQFCGQCGSPIFPTAGIDDGTALQRSVYPGGVRGPADSWSAADQDAPTEEFGPYSPGGYPRQFGASGYYAQSAAASAAGSDTRLLIGILCVLGGLLSAAGAIVLAILH